MRFLVEKKPHDLYFFFYRSKRTIDYELSLCWDLVFHIHRVNRHFLNVGFHHESLIF